MTTTTTTTTPAAIAATAPPAAARDTVRAAAAGVSSHLLWQVSARAASFAIRAVVVRALGPAQFAFVEIRLGLLVSLALLPAIAAFRKVCLRAPDDRAAAALAYCCVAVTLLLAAALTAVALRCDPVNAAAWAVVAASLFLRAFAEPFLVFARRRERYMQSSRARAVCTVLSGLGQTVAVAFIMDERLAAPAGALGHLFYSASMLVAMYFASGPERVPLLAPAQFVRALRADDLAMTGVGLGSGMLKFLLENGEGIVLDVSCPAPVKGAYKLAGNFASMLARFFSEALEEQSFNVFHRLAPAFRNGDTSKVGTDKRGADDASAAEREKDRRVTCVSTLNMALKAAVTVSVLIALVGPSYSYASLRLLYGEKWADGTAAAAILNHYFIYLVFMAGNGVSEAFVSAAASTSELKSQTKFTTLLSAAYMSGLYYAAVRYQAGGIIVVNCINMLIRTCYSAWFYRKFTGLPLSSLRSAIPHYGVICTLLVAQCISRVSERYFMQGALDWLDIGGKTDLLVRIGLHGISGGLALALFGASLRVFEADFLTQIRSLRSHQD